ncbi:hypothetical protein O3P69_012237 [Scylla paramamosain]|uniref:Uncharacterized protein n=2 Tax=Scylla paramamosain TaxID=85552 RepID=A0AAW0TD75_SCYPA
MYLTQNLLLHSLLLLNHPYVHHYYRGSVEGASVMWCSSSGYHSQVPRPLTTTTATSEASLKLLTGGGDDDESDDDSAWGEDEWPLERPLPLPEWGCGRPSLVFSTMQDYRRFLTRVSTRLHRALALQPYDSVSNFVMFAEEYKASEFSSLQDFYRYYDPPLVSGRYTCVGLAADLASRLADLEGHYPGFKDSIYQVSCEEEVTEKEVVDIISTEEPSPSASLKEHVLLCVRIHVEGRVGVVLLDPGYHVPCPVTVMEDGLAPHSGPVETGTARSDVQRFYTYHFPSNSSSYVIWEVEERRSGRSKWTRSLVHVSRPYLSGVDVTERRNLAYTFKTLLGRDAAGKFNAGLYFVIKPSSSPSSTAVSFFRKVNEEMKHVKKPLAYFLQSEEKEELDDEVEESVLAVEIGVGRARGDIRATLVTLASFLQDKGFLDDLLELNGAQETLREP